MAVPFWDDTPEAWDTLTLSGQALPGVARVEVALSQKIDVKAAPGASGAGLTYQGYEPSQISISLKIWLAEHLSALPALYAKIKPKDGSAPTAFDAAHPVLELAGITALYVTKISTPKEAQSGIYEISISALEFLPLAKGSSGQATGSSGAGKGKSKTKEVDADIRKLDGPPRKSFETDGVVVTIVQPQFDKPSKGPVKP